MKLSDLSRKVRVGLLCVLLGWSALAGLYYLAYLFGPQILAKIVFVVFLSVFLFGMGYVMTEQKKD